jgi:hypothetical protein
MNRLYSGIVISIPSPAIMFRACGPAACSVSTEQAQRTKTDAAISNRRFQAERRRRIVFEPAARASDPAVFRTATAFQRALVYIIQDGGDREFLS